MLRGAGQMRRAWIASALLAAGVGAAEAKGYSPRVDDKKAICGAFFAAVAKSQTVDEATAQKLTEIAAIFSEPDPSLSDHMKQQLIDLRSGLEVEFSASYLTDPEDRYSGREDHRRDCVDFARERPETQALFPD